MKLSERNGSSEESNLESADAEIDNGNGRPLASNQHFYSRGRDFFDDQYGSDSDDSINDKLDFSRPIAYLRQQELDDLNQAYELVLSRNGVKAVQGTSVCIIQGQSGTGKSTLFELFLDQKIASNSKQKAYVLRGKYEEFSGGNPLSAIVEAFSGLAEALLGDTNCDQQQEINQLRDRIISNLGGRTSAARLSSIFSDLEPLLTKSFSRQPSDLSSISHDKDPSASTDVGRNATNSSTECPLACSNGYDRDGRNENSSESHFKPASTRDSSYALNQIKYMFRALTMAICSSDRPVILFLDDLQWCDAGSMELIESLLLDKELKNFFFVGAYRLEENQASFTATKSQNHGSSRDFGMNDTSRHNNPNPTLTHSNMSRQLLHWNAIRKAHPRMVTITTKNLSVDGLVHFLVEVLRLENDIAFEEEKDCSVEPRVREFAGTLHEQTRGNIFFTRQILEELYAKKLLTFSHITFTWDWNVDEIELLDNVVEAVMQRIHSNSSPLLQKILSVAAYMRNTVDVEALKLMMALQGTVLSEKDLIAELEKAVSAGFLKKHKGTNGFCFSHDRIKEAAYMMIPEGKAQADFQHGIGSSLYKMSKDPRLGKDWMILSAADHLNITYTKDSLFLSTLNLKAGEKCVSVAAFDSACKYLSVARMRIKSVPDPWDNHYDLTLNIFALTVEAELARGNWQVGQEISEEVLKYANSIDDRLPTQLALVKALGRKKSHMESLLLALSTLQSLGLYSQSSVGVSLRLIQDLLFVRRYFNKITDEAILSLPESQSVQQGIVTELFCSAIHQSYFCGRVVDFLALTLKALRLNLRDGLTPISGRLLATYFLVCDGIGDFENASRFAKLGLELASRYPQRSMYGYVIYLKTVFLDAWSMGPDEVADLYSTSYKRSMEVGDFESALICQASALDHDFLAGRPLALLDVKFAELVRREEIYHNALMKVTLQQWLPIRHLRGTSDEVLNFDTMVDFGNEDTTDKIYLAAGYSARVMLAVFWGNYGCAKNILAKVGPVQDTSYTGSVPRLFFTAIVYNALYRETRQKAYRKRGKAAAQDLLKSSELKGTNSLHRCKIADAHARSCSKRKQGLVGVLKLFDEAIDAALNCDHKQDAALASQLAAEYLVGCEDNISKANVDSIAQYLKNARNWYRQWGATNLVRHLEQKFSTYLPPLRS